MIDITMLTCNRARLTEIAIREIKRRTTTPHRLVVLDNGSEDETPTMLEDLYGRELIDVLEFSDRNYGVHWGHNALLDLVKSEPHYVCTDNDLFPQAPVAGMDWLTLLRKLAITNPDYAAIACRPHVLIGEGGRLFEDSPPIRNRGHVGAHLRIMRTSVVRAAGGWNRKHKSPKRNNEERWICKRLRDLGYKVGYSRDVRCIHLFGSEEFDEDPWGYSSDSDRAARGHREIWPPVNVYSWDRRGIDWETCK